MKGRAKKQLPLAFASVVIKFEILHQNLEFPKNQVPGIVPTY
jgi:hypothetical protein